MNNSLKRVIHDVLRSTVQKSVNSYVSYSWDSAVRISHALGYTFLNPATSTEDLHSMLERELTDV